MVPFVGVFTSLVVSLAIHIYLRFWASHGGRNAAFERFCGGRPLLFAFFCPRAGVDRLLPALVGELGGKAERVSVEGVFPWPDYNLRLTAERLNDCVVGVRVTGFRLVRGQRPIQPLLPVIEAMCSSGLGVAEVWLHGDLYSDEARLEPEMTWRGAPSPDGQVQLRAFTELPFWLRPLHGGGPPRPRRDHSHQEAPVGGLLVGG
jgi:hypothetical protein